MGTHSSGSIRPKMGGKWRVLAKIFANPDLPEIDDYYEPFTFDYAHLQKAGESKAFPTARPRSLISGERMEKSNGVRIGRKFSAANLPSDREDYNFEGVQKEIYGQFENTFMMYLRGCVNTASTQLALRPAPRAQSTSARKTA